MKKILFLSLAFITFILLISCSDDSTSPSAPAEIMPLAVGNYWIMERLQLDSLGNVEETDYDTLMIDKDTIINDKHYFGFDEGGLRNGSDGMYRLDYDDENEIFIEVLIFKYPASVGYKYMLEDEEITVVSTNISVTVPAGTFKCYLYRRIYEHIDEDYPEYNYRTTYDIYLSPGIGLIKEDNRSNYLNGEFRYHNEMNLKEYKLMK